MLRSHGRKCGTKGEGFERAAGPTARVTTVRQCVETWWWSAQVFVCNWPVDCMDMYSSNSAKNSTRPKGQELQSWKVYKGLEAMVSSRPSSLFTDHFCQLDVSKVPLVQRHVVPCAFGEEAAGPPPRPPEAAYGSRVSVAFQERLQQSQEKGREKRLVRWILKKTSKAPRRIESFSRLPPFCCLPQSRVVVSE